MNILEYFKGSDTIWMSIKDGDKLPEGKRKGRQILCRWMDDWDNRYFYAVASYYPDVGEWGLSTEGMSDEVYCEFECTINEWAIL